MLVREMNVQEQPQNRLLECGANFLSNAELLSVLIGENGKNSSLDIAYKLLAQSDGLPGLEKLTVHEMEQVDGMTKARIAKVMAAMELGKRSVRYNTGKRVIVSCPEDAADYAMPILKHEQKEHFCVILLNVKNHILSMPVISVGSLTTSVVHPREVFNTAIKNNAAAMILVHNHPSGDPTPSKEDIATTKRLVEVGKLMDIPVLDHVIIGQDKFVSLNEKGIIR